MGLSFRYISSLFVYIAISILSLYAYRKNPSSTSSSFDDGALSINKTINTTPVMQVSTNASKNSTSNSQAWRLAAINRGMNPNGIIGIINSKAQSLVVILEDGSILKYKVSTSKFGIGNAVNSYKTPLGWHKVTERFGDNAKPGSIFSSRSFTGKVIPQNKWSDDKSDDYVLTRIMWLTGLEPGINSGNGIDSHDRCIYIHGTNQEHLIGSPASHGCIRMTNKDVIQLFNLTANRDFYCVII